MRENKRPSPEKHYTRAELAAVARDKGWTVDKTRGKGGHWWFTKNGHPPFPVPEQMGNGLQENIKKRLGIRDEK